MRARDVADGGARSALIGSLNELVVKNARERPDLVAFRFLPHGEEGEETLTFAELGRRTAALSARLLERAPPASHAVLLLAPGLDYIVAFFACLRAGIVAVPAYPPQANRPLDRLRALLVDSQASMVLVGKTAYERLARHVPSERELEKVTWVVPEDEPLDSTIDDAEAVDPAMADTLALLQYTSGSTSDPKGVMITHANLIHNALALSERLGLTARDHVVGWLPPYHDMGLIGGLVLPTWLGAPATLFPPSAFIQRPLRWLRAMSRHRGTVSGGPNFAYELCAQRITDAQIDQLDLTNWRVAVTGAERVRPETVRQFTERFSRAGLSPNAIVPCYGLAEATLGVTVSRVDEQARIVRVLERSLEDGRIETATAGSPGRDLVSTGRPIADTEAIIVNTETCRLAEPGEVGEIWVRGPSVASGYYGRPELSAQTFGARLATAPEGPSYLRTGDLGFLHEGEVVVAGRSKDLVILLGTNHFPEDIERTVERAHSRLRSAGSVAFAVDEGGEERLVVVAEVDTSRDVPVEGITQAVQRAVVDEHGLVIFDLVLVKPGTVPRTSSGKVQRGRCKRSYLDQRLDLLAKEARPTVAADAQRPRLLLPTLTAAMADVLERDHVEPTEDFFALGGDSLSATQLVSRVRDALGVELPLRAVFESPTPLGLTERLGSCPRRSDFRPVERVARDKPLSLSFAQERMWFLHRLDPSSAAYNVAGAVIIEGPLDTDAVDRALRELVSRHEVFRTTYPTVDGTPIVRISDSVSITVPLIDLSTHPDPERAATELSSELARAPFSLEADVLLRARLFRLGPERHAMAVSTHHVVSDGWSMGLFLSELLRLYGRMVHGRPLPAREDALDYADFADWQRRELGGDHLRPQIDYWARVLAGSRPLELPTDRPRRVRLSLAGEWEPLELGPDLLDSLRALAKRERATLFMVLLAAFDVLLYRYTRQTDIVIGTPIANRNRLAAETLMGTLVNTVPLRMRFEPEWSFSTLLEHVKEVALGAHENQDIPFERLVSDLGVERRPGRSPLFDVLFDFQNAPMRVRQAEGLSIRPLRITRRSSQFDLSLLILDTELGHIAGVEYSTDLFDAATIRRFLEHYALVLGTIAKDPSIELSRIPLMSDEERREISRALSSSTPGEPPRDSVHDRFERQVAKNPEAIAVIDDQGAWTYRELESAMNAIVAQLRTQSVVPGSRVAVLLSRTRLLPAVLLAVLKSGATYVPIDPRYPSERIAFVLEDAAPLLLVTDAEARFARSPPVLRLDPAEAHVGQSSPVAASRPESSATAYLLYTSGSTGRPKGVEVSVDALSNFLTSMAKVPGMHAADRLLSVTTISFDIAALELFLPLTVGASVRIAPSEAVLTGGRLRALLEESRATVMQATPSLWRLLIDAGWAGDRKLKILCGGEALDRSLADELLARGGEVYNLYGPTETTVWSTVHRVAPGSGPVPIGKPIDHTSIYVLDADRQWVPRGVVGEIYIGGAGVARGYFRRPELTDQRFVPDPFSSRPGARMYRTGDLGRISSAGELECLGRVDAQVKIRGHRVELGEIEVALCEHPAVREAAAAVVELSPGDARLAAYYVPKSGMIPVRSELRALLSRKLPEYMMPSYLVALDAMPTTPNRKVDRGALPPPHEGHRSSEVERIYPRDDLESAIATAFEDFLGMTGIGVRDSFFDLGGHSLLAARLFSRIERQLGAELPLAILLEAPTVERVAEIVRSQRKGAVEVLETPGRRLVPVRTSGTRAPFYCVHGAGGNVLNLHEVARHLLPNRPFYGLQARGVDGKEDPYPSIEATAEAYLAELRAAQPHGPYFLSGYCGGGLVVFEMAVRLASEGEPIACLILLDTYRPGLRVSTSRGRRWAKALATEQVDELIRRGRRKVDRDLALVTQAFSIHYHRFIKQPVPHELRDHWLTASFLRIAARYEPPIYGGRLTLFRARDADPALADYASDLGWGSHAAGGIDVYEVPGDHHSIAREPNVHALAAKLDACLEVAEQNSKLAENPSRAITRRRAGASVR